LPMDVDDETKNKSKKTEVFTDRRRAAGVKKKYLKLRRGITVDSGAANNVMPRKMVRDRKNIRPSKGSIAGVHYVAANSGRMPNEGEYDFKFTTAEGEEEEMTFQIAEVNKALGSVSYLVDRGYKVVFDQDAKTGKDVSYMMHKSTGRTTKFKREKNVWILEAMIEADETPFHRQG
jgi:hypothetical protein